MTSHRTSIAAAIVAVTATIASACGASTTTSSSFGSNAGASPTVDSVDGVASTTLLVGVEDPDNITTTAPTTTTEPPATSTSTTTTTTTTPPPTTAPPTTAPPTTVPPTTAPPTTMPPTTVPPTTAPPTTMPPTTTTQPAPAPEPVTIDLLSAMQWSVEGSAADGAGGSGEAQRRGSSGLGIRATALHGWNGDGSARVEASYSFDATDHLGGHEVAMVQVRFQASGNGVLKAPNDRWARVWVDGLSTGRFPQGDPGVTFIKEEISAENADNSEFYFEFNSGGSHDFLVTGDHPVVSFRYQAWCDAESGSMAGALFNEGYCDFFERGGIQFNSFKMTVTPMPNYTVVDGTPVEIID